MIAPLLPVTVMLASIGGTTYAAAQYLRDIDQSRSKWALRTANAVLVGSILALMLVARIAEHLGTHLIVAAICFAAFFELPSLLGHLSKRTAKTRSTN